MEKNDEYNHGDFSLSLRGRLALSQGRKEIAHICLLLPRSLRSRRERRQQRRPGELASHGGAAALLAGQAYSGLDPARFAVERGLCVRARPTVRPVGRDSPATAALGDGGDGHTRERRRDPFEVTEACKTRRPCDAHVHKQEERGRIDSSRTVARGTASSQHRRPRAASAVRTPEGGDIDAASYGTVELMISSGEDEQQQWHRDDVVVERQQLIQELRRWQREAADTALRWPAMETAFPLLQHTPRSVGFAGIKGWISCT
ncbi:uncharacterized protein [Triticum aestivum]|uniref:uncharacterized protein n=1 Tax=Triticum aestivum TaxID=4565 RepID=UPI001D02AED6|nr:uncharacterized protein LOC123076160 [Triticum aestivum]